MTEIDDGKYEITLTRPISAGEWTTIAYSGDGSHVTYASLPADANGDRRSAPADILRLIDCLNGVAVCSDPWQRDIDHSGLFRPPDITRLIDLLNGAGEFIPWLNVELPLVNTCPGRGEGAEGGGDATALDEIVLADANAEFIDGYVDYVATSALPDAESESDFKLIVDAMSDFCARNLSEAERKTLAEKLQDPSLKFASTVAAKMVSEIVETLLR